MTNGVRKNSCVHPDSVLVFTPADSDTQAQADLVHCVHCGAAHCVGASIDGLVNKTLTLGFCGKCRGITCGEACQECVPTERSLEIIERSVGGVMIP